MIHLTANSFADLHVLVIGDAMLDRYFHGVIERQSPEANAPIVKVVNTEDRLGGAANVALNVQDLGASASLVSLVGDDVGRQIFQHLAKQANLPTFLLVDNHRPTTIKTRLYSQNEYVLRFDEEEDKPLSEDLTQQLLQTVEKAVEAKHPDVAILQDYNKGIFTEDSIKMIIAFLKERNIPIVVDPKNKHFFAYQGVDLFKPNLKEALAVYPIKQTVMDNDGYHRLGTFLHNQLNGARILVTLSEEGAFAYDGEQFLKVEAFKRHVVDVSGAGDTVVSVAGLLLAKGSSLHEILYISNLSGGLVIEEKGVCTLSIDKLVDALNHLG